MDMQLLATEKTANAITFLSVSMLVNAFHYQPFGTVRKVSWPAVIIFATYLTIALVQGVAPFA